MTLQERLISSQLFEDDKKVNLEFLKLKKPILILGDHGSGKSMIAQYLGQELKESTYYLSGKENAMDSHLGQLNKQGATLLIFDDIDAFSLRNQAELEEYLMHVKANVKIISTALPSLSQKVRRGEFRLGLYNLLNGKNIMLKNWSELTLAHRQFIIEGWIENLNLKVPPFKVLEQLSKIKMEHNFRSLCSFFTYIQSKKNKKIEKREINIIEKSFILPSSMPIEQKQFIDENELMKIKKLGFKKFIKEFEKQMLSKVLEKNMHHVRKTIQVLKISNASFYRILRH